MDSEVRNRKPKGSPKKKGKDVQDLGIDNNDMLKESIEKLKDINKSSRRDAVSIYA